MFFSNSGNALRVLIARIQGTNEMVSSLEEALFK